MLVSEPLRGLLLAVFLLASCSNIAFYDQAAYANAVDTKVQTLALMNLAVNPYSSQSAEIAGVNLQMQKAYEYDRGRPMNQTTLQMWDVLLKTKPSIQMRDFGLDSSRDGARAAHLVLSSFLTRRNT
jgi:hypothetical protein